MLLKRWKKLIGVSLALALAVGVLGRGNVCSAAMISYADKGPVGGFMFTDISESSVTDPLPLYGDPSPFVIGLDFNPQAFAASGANGLADITDGQLNFTVMGPTLAISLYEDGDYTLDGVGTANTRVRVGAIMRATIKELNGNPVAPIILTPVNASLAFNLIANPGFVEPWSLGLTLDVAAQLAGLGYGPGTVATKIDVAINNQLLAFSEVGTVAFIAKKEFITTITEVPEPATIALGMLLSGCGIGALRRRRKPDLLS